MKNLNKHVKAGLATTMTVGALILSSNAQAVEGDSSQSNQEQESEKTTTEEKKSRFDLILDLFGADFIVVTMRQFSEEVPDQN